MRCCHYGLDTGQCRIEYREGIPHTQPAERCAYRRAELRQMSGEELDRVLEEILTAREDQP